MDSTNEASDQSTQFSIEEWARFQLGIKMLSICRIYQPVDFFGDIFLYIDILTKISRYLPISSVAKHVPISPNMP